MIDCAMCGGPGSANLDPLCAGCRDCSARDVGMLALDYADLAGRLPASGGPELRITGTHTPGVPMDLTADELRRGIAWTLGVWEPPVREAAGLAPAAENVHPDRLVNRAAGVLSVHVSHFAALGDTWGYPEGLEGGCVAMSGLYGVLYCRALHGRARRALGLTSPRWQLPGLCPRCGFASLTRTAGSDFVDCAQCGSRVDSDDYRAYVAMMIGEPHHSFG